MPEFTFNIEAPPLDPPGRAFSIQVTKHITKMTPQEKQAYAAIKKEHGSFMAPDNVYHSKALAALNLLRDCASCGQLAFAGDKLIPDFFTSANFSFHVDRTESGEMFVEALISFGKKQYHLSECDLLCKGSSHWVVKRPFLKILPQAIEWQWLQPFQSQKQVVFTDPDFFEENKEFIILKTNLSSPKKEVFPLLKLKDRTGAFADLLILEEETQTPYHEIDNPISDEKFWEEDLLETDFIRKQVGSTHYYCPLNLVKKSLTFLLECGWKIVDDQNRQVHLMTETTLDIIDEDRSLLIKGEISFSEYQADLSQVVGCLSRQQHFIPLAANSVGLLPEMAQIQSLEEGEVVGEGIKLPKNRFGALKELFDSPFNITAPDHLEYVKNALEDFVGIKKALPSKRFTGTLRPYQQEGLDWLSFLHGYGFHGLLADDMGLGKTVQVLAFLSQQPLDQLHLIVVPTTLLFNWKHEIKSFLKDIPVIVHHGPKREKQLPSSGIVLTSYGTLRQDLSLFQPLNAAYSAGDRSQSGVKSHSFDTMLLDEAQTIKNSGSQIAGAVCKIAAKYRLAITGTPVENSIQELWSLFRFLMPDLLGDKQSFDTETLSAQVDPRYLKRIERKIRPFMLRRKKDQVLKDLPEKIEQTVFVQMQEEQRKEYDHFLAGARKKVTLEGEKANRMEVLEKILRLRQMCCHPQLVGREGILSAKLEALLADVITLTQEGRKILVYSQFTSMLTLIGNELKKEKIPFLRLDGKTKNREERVDSFQTDTEIPVFLISLKAGGVGLNLTAADTVLLFDPWWNVAVENQAIDRAHRIGQKNSVLAKRYIMVDTIEEKMMTLKASKKTLSDDLFGEGAQGGLTLEDLAYLLE